MKTFCFVFLLMSPFLLDADQVKKKTICLNMIVKNEEHVIERALSSVKTIIDYWVIVDTGSTDATARVIHEVLQDIPGELYYRPWKNFGDNRTEALMLAKEKADYLLFLDADDWIEYEQGFQISDLTKDSYHAFWNSHHVKGFSYLKPLIVKSSLPWVWKDVLHEYLTCEGSHSQEVLQNIKYVFSGEGARSKNPDKYLEAAKILEEALLDEPNNSRYVFYLGESYKDANELEKALSTYQKRSEMGGWEEEVFWSLLQIAHLKKRLQYPIEEVLQSYHKAHSSRPYRSEPIYFLSEMYNQNQNHVLAYEVIKGWQALPKEENSDQLFKMTWIDEYGILFQLSIAAFYIKKYEECFELNNQLLRLKNLPKAIKRQVHINRKFPIQKLEELLIEE